MARCSTLYHCPPSPPKKSLNPFCPPLTNFLNETLVVADRDSVVETMMAERDRAVAQRERAVAERDRAVVERDRAVVERDRAVVENEVIRHRKTEEIESKSVYFMCVHNT